MKSMQRRRYDQLKFTDDFMFGAVMTTFPEIARALTEKITGRKIREIIAVSGEQVIGTDPLLKRIRMDVRFTDDEAVYCVEMQMYRDRAFPKRVRYYAAVNDIDQIERGGEYGDLKPVYVIFICNYDPFGRKLRKYTFRNRCDEDPSCALGDESVKIVLNTAGDRSTADEELNRLLDYFTTGIPDSGYALTEMIETAVERIRHDREWRERFMSYHLSFEYELKQAKEQAAAEGRAEGIAQGRAEGIAEGRAEGRTEGRREAREDAIRMTVEILLEAGLSESETKARVTEKYSIDGETYDAILARKSDLTE